MKYDLIIDAISCVGKCKIDKKDMSPFAKEIAKMSIDVAANCLKANLNCSVDCLKPIADKYGITKVVVFPCALPSGEEVILLRAYGKNSQKFLEEIGVPVISEEKYREVSNLIEFAEKENGVKIYG